MAGTAIAYNSFRVKSINLKWLYFHSACPSSSNRLNTWMLFGYSISTMLIKPSYFNIHFTSLYLRDVIWKIMILITGRRCVFSYNDDTIVSPDLSHDLLIVS